MRADAVGISPMLSDVPGRTATVSARILLAARYLELSGELEL